MRLSTIKKLSFYLLLLFCLVKTEVRACGFVANARTGCQGSFTLNLQDTTNGSTHTSWNIHLANGTNVITTNNHQASLAINVCGKVIVTMTTTDAAGNPCTAVDSNFFVYCKPIIKGRFTPNVTCLGGRVCYLDSSTTTANCSPLRYQISFGQGLLDTVLPACHTYTLGGTFCPSLVVTNSCGCISDSTFAAPNCILVTAPPAASFTGNPLNSCTTPQVSTMTATLASSRTVYKWYINGSTVAAQSGTSNIFAHSYATGTYDIKLIVIDTLSGCSDTLVRPAYVTVGSTPASCDSADATTGCAPRQVVYCPCNPGALSYTWSFPGAGPGGTTLSVNSTTPNCQTVTYSTPGAYSHQLITQYAGGCVDTLNRINYVTIGTLYTLNISSIDTYSCTLPDTVHLSYTGQPCPSCTFQWNPPGSSTPTSPNGTTVILNSYQNYTPILRVTDTFGCVSSIIRSNYIQAQKLKAADIITKLHLYSCIGDTFLVVNSTLGRPFTSVSWSFPGASVNQVGQDSVYLEYGAAGCHKYTLIVRSQAGCIDTLRDSICVGTKPDVSMTVSPHDMCYEAMCNIFSATLNNGSDTPTSILIWPEGLGHPGVTTTIQPGSGGSLDSCYMYMDYGTFNPCFVAKNNGCYGDTVCMNGPLDTIFIKRPAAKALVRFNCSNPNFVTYINQSLGADSIIWHILGNTYINQDTVTVHYPGPCGSKYAFSITAFNDTTGCSLTKNDTTVIPCLGLDFVAVGSTKGCTQSVLRDSLDVFYTDTTITHPSRIVWSVNFDGSPPTFASPPALSGSSIQTYLFNPGKYTACAQFTFATGCVDTLCKPTFFVISKPVASFTVSDTVGCTPFHVSFTNTSTYNFAGADSFYWNFGDGSPVNTTTVAPNHTYSSVNTYVASLTVVDSNGCSSVATRQIISDSIRANFVTSDSITCTTNPDPLNPITFTDASSGYVAHYRWSLPASLGPTNPNPGDVPSFSSQFTAQGWGNVCLVVSDQFGVCSDSICKPIHIINPVADYTIPNLADTLHFCPPVVINPFIDQSTNNICKCFWDFGDGSHFDTACNAAHIYNYPGDFCVKHIVTSCHGCQDSITKYCIHIKGPVVHLSVSGPGGCPCVIDTYYVSSYDANQLTMISGGGNPLFINRTIPRGTQANPTLDTFTFVYCNAADAVASVQAYDAVTNCTVTFYSQDTLAIDTPSTDFSHTWRGCHNDTVCFADLTHYSASHAFTAQRAWDFGDGSPIDSTPNPCHRYLNPGSHTVTLSVRDNVNCTNTISHNVYVPVMPHAAIGINDSIGCVPLTLLFTDSSTVDDSTSIAQHIWNFGDGSAFASAGPDTSYTYTVPNTPPNKYNVILVVQDTFGCTDTAHGQVQVNPPSNVTIGPAQTICPGDTATLSGAGSPTLHWFPVYNIDTTNLAAPRVWPQVDTTYYLRAGNILRCYVFDSVRINVARITASDTAYYLCLGQATALTALAQSTHATISSYDWTLGDGTVGAGSQINHVYPHFGVFADMLIVTNSIGCKDTVLNTVRISDKPHAAVSVSDSSICLGAPITVTNTSTPGTTVGLAGFTVDMQPDGVPEFTTTTNTFTYPSRGFYVIQLIQTDSNACLDTAKQKVIVHTIPAAVFNGDSNCIKLPTELSGNGIIGDGNITHYHWTVNGSALTSDSSVITHVFNNPGIYNVCLSVSDTFGCQSPDSCSNVVILSQPLDSINPMDTTICIGYSAGFNITGTFSSVQWVPSTWVSDPRGTNVVVTPRQTMQYLVYAYFGHCNPKIDTVSIWVIDSVPVAAAANPESIVLGLSSNVTSTVKGTIDSIVWDPDTTLSCRSCRNPIATPKQTTTYTATVYYSRNGIVCSNRASVTITVISSCDNSLIYVPNTFTPNNDNTNDVFRLRGQGITKVNYFRVFDRWGKKVFEADNVEDPDNAAWNGGLNNDRGKPENSGVFVYLFEIQCVTGQTVTGKGNVTLIR